MAILFVDLKGEPERPSANPCNRTQEQIGYVPFGHTRVWAVRRAPVEQMGHFMVFYLNGSKYPIDASVPTHLDKLPRDAVEITGELAEQIWHCRCGSYVMGCCYLREVNALLSERRRDSYERIYPHGNY